MTAFEGLFEGLPQDFLRELHLDCELPAMSLPGVPCVQCDSSWSELEKRRGFQLELLNTLQPIQLFFLVAGSAFRIKDASSSSWTAVDLGSISAGQWPAKS